MTMTVLWVLATAIIAVASITIIIRARNGSSNQSEGGENSPTKEKTKKFVGTAAKVLAVIIVIGLGVETVFWWKDGNKPKITSQTSSAGKRDFSGLPTVSVGKPLILAPGSGFNGPGYTREIRVVPPRGKTCGLTYEGCVDVHFPVECTPERINLSYYCKGKSVGKVVDVVVKMCGPSGLKPDGKIVVPHKNDDTHTHNLGYGRLVSMANTDNWVSLEELNISTDMSVTIAVNAGLAPNAAGLNTVSRENPVKISLNYCH